MIPSSSPASAEADRLLSLLASGKLMHPYLSSDHFARRSDPRAATDEDSPAAGVAARAHSDDDDVRDNFVDLAASLAICCGAPPPPAGRGASHRGDVGLATRERDAERGARRRRRRLASEIGGHAAGATDEDGVDDGDDMPRCERRHIVLILCDGMGNSVLPSASGPDPSSSSFFARHNRPSRLRAVFPSTTPAALTTLATAAWPGRHGMPGWNLRDKRGCDLPGNQSAASQPVQLLVLSDHIRDDRSGKLASEMGFESWDDIFVEVPWARKLSSGGSFIETGPGKTEQKGTSRRRRMIYVNAYNGDDYQNWSQGGNNDDDDGKGARHSDGTDFSLWTMGGGEDAPKGSNDDAGRSTLFETAKIAETSFETLGTPEGSAAAVEYFRRGIDAAIAAIARAERSDESTFVYLYTAHPDKHMHALGVEHEEVRRVVGGIEAEVERFWRVLGSRETLLSGKYDVGECDRTTSTDGESTGPSVVDAAIVVTADHGHVTVHEHDMVELPKNILDLLEYACIGVHGKGRHGYLHCRAGLQAELLRRWRADSELCENFLLLTIEDAIAHGLFGPSRMRLEVRPRLGDFVAVSVGRKTLVSPSEAERFKKPCRCQGAHGSLLPEEMSIPFILLLPDGRRGSA